MNQRPDLIATVGVKVASWDVDARNRLTTSALGRHMQEAAEVSAQVMGAGYKTMLASGQIWVLSGLLLRVDRTPRFTDAITVETWPRDIERRRALRDFRIRNADGEVVATATTAWYCLDLASRRPVSPEPWRTVPWLTEERATDRDPARLPGAGDEPNSSLSIPVRWNDLDLNGHITNTRFQDLIIESYEPEWLREHSIAEIEVNFMAEGRYPDTVHSRRRRDDDAEQAWHHSLVRESDGKEMARGRVVWR